MSMCHSNQLPLDVYIKCNRFRSLIKCVAKDLSLLAVLPDHVTDNGCSCTKLLGVNSDENIEATALKSSVNQAGKFACCAVGKGTKRDFPI